MKQKIASDDALLGQVQENVPKARREFAREFGLSLQKLKARAEARGLDSA